MNKSIDYVIKCKVMQRGIISQYKMKWKSLDEALFHKKPNDYYYPEYIVTILNEINALIPIVYYAFDAFPHEQIYKRIDQLIEETWGKI